MLKKIIFALFCLSLIIFAGCFSDTASKSDAPSANSETQNLPEGIEIKPIQPDGKTTPGIPDPKTADARNVPQGTTPTPGIPDSKEVSKPTIEEGTTPTPGIPSQEELKQQRERRVDSTEVNPSVKKNDDNETTSPIDRKRRAGKPPVK